ncbi:MAG TPA: hypothetical protein VFL14_01820 [Xanthomonadales bacterium]|nr:hypothetical protein [Xanthomonadales bacterium]
MPVTMTVRENSTGTLNVSDGKDLPLELQVTVSPSATQAPDSARVNVAFLISQTKNGQKKLVGDPGMELTLGTIGTLSLSGSDKSSESLSLRVSVARLTKPVDDSGWAECVDSKGGFPRSTPNMAKDDDCCQAGCSPPPGTMTCCNACCSACGAHCCVP